MVDVSRRQHRDSRTSENFTEQGLQTLTGQKPGKWVRYTVKELLDNALEAVEDALDAAPDTVDGTHPRLRVTAEHAGGGVQALTVRDNGPGMDAETVHSTFGDMDRFAGTKRHYALPTRGNQGNALMTILGIQHVADTDHDLTVRTNGTRHVVRVAERTLDGSPQVTIYSEPDLDAPTPGVEVAVDYTGSGFGKILQVEKTVAQFAALNPHARFELEVNDRRTTRTPRRACCDSTSR